MIQRTILPLLQKAAAQYPVVTLIGPRQSGKTTLSQYAFSKKPYCSLEALDTRMFAQSDPRGFLAQYPDGAIVDEIQNVPDLLSYIQERVDKKKQMGEFIVTGSQNFSITQSVSQSLAGRTAILNLLPLTFSEISSHTPNISLWETIWKGGYPRIYNAEIDAQMWIKNYITTYIERDVRAIVNIPNLQPFRTFMQLFAANTAQELNYSRIGADVGISYNTIKNWISVLMASFLGFSLPAYSPNIRKQIVKHPKFHFFDTGIVCALLGISSPKELSLHSLRGFIFETWVVSEIQKEFFNKGITQNLLYYRESRGKEFDLLIQNGAEFLPCEIKSSHTIASDFFKNFTNTIPNIQQKGVLIYAGDQEQNRTLATVLPWNRIVSLVKKNGEL